MAVYKVKEARALLPVRYMEAGGALADHNTDDNLLAVNQRGAAMEVYQPVAEGAVFYTDAASFEAAQEEAGEDGIVYYVTNEQYVQSHVKLGTFKEVQVKKQATEKKQAAKQQSKNDDK